MLFDAADMEIQERLQALSRPGVWHLERLQAALAAWASEQRAPTADALAYSAGVPARISEVLLSDLEEAGLIERDQDGGIAIGVALESFAAGVRNLVAKLKTFRFESERRLQLVADYAQSKECRSVFLRRYFGEDHPPCCGCAFWPAPNASLSKRAARKCPAAGYSQKCVTLNSKAAAPVDTLVRDTGTPAASCPFAIPAVTPALALGTDISSEARMLLP